MDAKLKSLFGYDAIIYRNIEGRYEELSDEKRLEQIRTIIIENEIKISNIKIKSLLSHDKIMYRNIGEEAKELTDSQRYLKLRDIIHKKS